MQDSFSSTWYDGRDRKRTAVIFQEQNRAVQDTPRKDWGDMWVYRWEPTHQYKSLLMHWGSASEDAHSGYEELRFRNLDSAIQYAKMHGQGYDVQLPRFRYHLRKAYIDNFKWKGLPPHKEENDD
jgi:hypothetical protein